MSSATPEWATPQELFDHYDRIFNFTLDPCSTHGNAKCAMHYTKEEDGLSKPWTGSVWMNPPYGKEIPKWVRKAYESAQEGATVVCLLPARTDTRWFHEWCVKGELTFLKGRLKFLNPEQAKPQPAPFPSMICVFFKKTDV